MSQRRDANRETHIVVMGVSGSGKTTVGRRLAGSLNREFLDADDFHSDAARRKMQHGEALTDEDREPWILRIVEALREDGNAPKVLACSALRARHREALKATGVIFVHLHAEPALLERRLAHRRDHFFAPALLDSQIDALEAPDNGITVDASLPLEELINQILRNLSR